MTLAEDEDEHSIEMELPCECHLSGGVGTTSPTCVHLLHLRPSLKVLQWLTRNITDIRKVFENQDIKIVPILVGAINQSKETVFGDLLAPYLNDSRTLFVVSSDFCHW